jgi:hypothetical protein
MHEVQESNQDGLSCISGVDTLSTALSLEGVASCLRINAAGRCVALFFVTCRYFYCESVICVLFLCSKQQCGFLRGIDETAPVYLG